MVEGEGCFFFRTRMVRGKRTRFRYKHTALITVGMTDKDVIQKLAVIWNSSVRTQVRGVNKTYYTTVVHGKQSIGWMMTLYSLMGIRRRDKIREIIQQWRGLESDELETS